MAIKRYKPDADTTIVNAFQPDLTTRGTGANMGEADVLETFSIYGRQSTSSQELSRILIKFPTADISSDRSAGVLPASGSVSFYLRMFNTPHSRTVPKDYTLMVLPIAQTWQEGVGLDLEEYKDLTRGNSGANWMMANGTNISEITKITFSSNTLADYGAGAGANYIILYNGISRYNLWFDDGSGDSAPDATGTEVEIDISSTTPAKASIAAQFSSVIGATDEFSTNIDSSDTSVIYVTASSAGPITSPSVEGTLSGIAMAIYHSGNDATPWTGSAYTTTWETVGASYRTGSSDPAFSAAFTDGLEDMNLDITPIVEHWMAGTLSNYGLGIHLSSSFAASASAAENETDSAVLPITGGATTSYYTKRFFARGSEFFFLRPVIEARWNSVKEDDRGDFYYSSSLAPGTDNMNTLYFYNYIRGVLRDIPDLGTDNRIYVSIFSGNVANNAPSGSALLLSTDNDGYVRSAASTVVTGGYVSTGIYSASFAITGATTPVQTLYDVWFTGSHTMTASNAAIQYFTGSIVPQVVNASETVSKPVYYMNITNLRGLYRSNETARFNLYVRNKYWDPTIYTVANSTPESTTIQSASYRVYRLLDAYEAVPYGTGSDFQTGLSYDVSGNYFDFDMNLLEPGYAYGFKFSFYDAQLDAWSEQPETFKFRVEDYEY